MPVAADEGLIAGVGVGEGGENDINQVADVEEAAAVLDGPKGQG